MPTVNSSNLMDFCGWGRVDSKTPRERVLEAQREAQAVAAKFAKPFFIAGQTQSGAGKCARLHKVVQKVTGKPLNIEPQPTGDCFPAGTMVAMADGTERPIETIQVGDIVLTHTGCKAKVLRLHSRKYTGKMNTIKAMNIGRSVTATASHEFVEVHGRTNKWQDWSQVSLLSNESCVLIPSTFEFLSVPEILNTTEVCGTDPNQFFHSGTVVSGCIQDPDAERGKMQAVKNPIPEHVKVDGDFGRLIGLYLAEGGSEGWKVQFSFSATEAETLVKETQSLLLSVFGLESKTLVRHANQSCIVVQCHSLALVTFLKALMPGNVYSKEVPNVIMRAPFHVRMACIQGWLDGDGHFVKGGRKKKAVSFVGVSASKNLGLSITRLAVSLGLRPAFNNRALVPGRTHRAIQVGFNGDSAVAIQNRTCSAVKKSKVQHGFAFRIRENTSHDVIDEMVYCIAVDHPEHSFIANSYAVHNCVMASSRMAASIRNCFEIAGGEFETFRTIFNPFGYAAGRVLIGQNRLRGGAGSIGGWQAQANAKYGFLSVNDNGGLPYNKEIADAWGDDRKYKGKSFRDFMEAATASKLQTWAPVQSWNESRDSLFHGYPLTIGSNRGYTMKPDRDGFHRPSGTWPHQLTIYSFWENVKVPTVGLVNTWGDVHGVTHDPETGEELPRGTLLVRVEDFMKYHLTAAAECLAYSDIDGFDAEIDWSAFG